MYFIHTYIDINVCIYIYTYIYICAKGTLVLRARCNHARVTKGRSLAYT